MIVPFLCFHGKAEEAITYYHTVFGFKLPHFLHFNEVENRGFDVPKSLSSGVMFTEFELDHSKIMACDYYPGLSSIPGQGISLNLILSDKQHLNQWAEALASEGRWGLKPQETLWAPWYASVEDKYGIVWQFSLDQ